MIDNNFNDKLRSGAYVRVLCEAGYKEALFGLSLSYRTLTPLEINGTKKDFYDKNHFLFDYIFHDLNLWLLPCRLQGLKRLKYVLK